METEYDILILHSAKVFPLVNYKIKYLHSLVINDRHQMVNSQ